MTRAQRLRLSTVAMAMAMAMAMVAVGLGASPSTAQMPLDDNCVVSALNRSTRVLADGSWVLPNVPSNFGFIRVRANCVENGATRAGQSAFVRLPPGGTLRVSDIVFSAPRPIPARLSLRVPRTALSAAGETVQLEAIATLPDGTLADVTASESGTNYRSSNPATATVSENGVVTAVSSGAVLVSATHEGALGVVQLTVVAAADTDGDGLPDDFEVANGLDPSNGADAQLDPDRDGLSTGDEFRRGLDPFDADTDGDGLDDGRETLLLGTDARRFDTDGDGLSDSLELELGTDPLDALSFDYTAALTALEVRPSSFALVYDTVIGEASTQLAVIGTLRDGTSIDLTAPGRGTAYQTSDLEVCRLSAEAGSVFAGQPGVCTITVTSGGRIAAALGIVQTFSPRVVAGVSVPGSANAVDVVADHAFVAAGDAGLQIVDVANRRAPRIVASIATSGPANDVAVAGGIAVVAASTAGLDVVDVATPASPRLLATAPLGGAARAVSLDGGGAFAVVADDLGGLAVVDLSDPSDPLVLGTMTTAGTPRAIALDSGGTIALVAEGPLGVEVFDLADREQPVARGSAATADARAVAFRNDGNDDYAVVGDASSGLLVVDLRDTAQPRVVASLPRAQAGIPRDVAWLAPLAFTADAGFFTDEAVPIFDLSDPLEPLARARLLLPMGDPGRAVDADATYVYLLACADCDGAPPHHSHLDIGQYRSLRDELGSPPQVTLTSPRDGDVVLAGSSLSIAADASDDVGVLAVELLVDGVVAGRDERPPFGFTITVPEQASRLTLGARAYDFAANRADAEEIEVAVTRPGITTVRGVVVDRDDQPVEGARVVVAASVGAGGGAPAAGGAGTGAASITTTGPDGVFLFADLAVGGQPLVAQASAALAGRKNRGGSSPVLPVAGGTTDLGAIRIEPIGVLYPGPRTFTGATANGMARADFDRDGIDDLAVIHISSTHGLAVLGGEGDGRFALRQRLAVGGFIVTAGDVNLDGAPDLVVVQPETVGGRYRVLRNSGDGTFELGETRVTAAPSLAARIADVDGDGLPDLILAHREVSDVTVLLGNGDGTLRSETHYGVGGSPEDLTTGDFDLDGRVDIAVAVTRTAAPHAVAILLGGGAGGLTPLGTLPFSLPPLRVAAGDFDGDGALDLAVGAGRSSDTQKVFVALGDGEGAFALASTLGTTLLGPATSLAIDDLDGDGSLDLAVGRDRQPCDDILLLHGDGAGHLDQPRAIVDDCLPPRIVTTDQTGDGLRELVALDDNGVVTYLARGGFTFERRLDIATTKPDLLVTADLDRDGRLDLIYDFESSKSAGIQLGNGDGTFRAQPALATGIFLDRIGAGDVNRDGVVDLVVSSLDEVGTLLGRGDGTFSPPVLLPIQRALSAVVVTDLGGDGAADVVATNDLTDRLVVFESRGDGTLEVASENAVGDTPFDVVVGDLDGDGVLDAAVANLVSDDVSILRGTGSGQFAPQVRFAARNSPHSMVAADLDLDGALDLVVVGTTVTPPLQGMVTLLMGDGEGGFGPPIALASASAVTRAAAADVDLDGVPDVLLLHPSDDVSILYGVGDGTFLPAERTRIGVGPSRIVVADVDGDGQPDLVTTSTDSARPGISVLLHR